MPVDTRTRKKKQLSPLRRVAGGVAVIVGFLLLLWLLWNNPRYSLWILVGLSAIFFFSFSFYAIVAAFSPDRKPVAPAKWPTVTILMPSYNSAATIRQAVAAAQAMTYQGEKELIVIDDSSTDGSDKIAEQMGARVLRRKGDRGKAKALNHGIQQAKGEIIVALDSDTFAPTDALEKAIPYFGLDAKIGAVTLFITVANAKNMLERIQQLEYYIAFGFTAKTMGKVNGLIVTPGPMSAYRKSALEQVGGFDEKNMTEDMEIGLRLHEYGWKIECCTETLVPTVVPDTLSKLYRQRVRWYRGTIDNIREYFHMFLNSNYHDIGLFSYPMTAIYVATTMLVWTVIWFNVLATLADAAAFVQAFLKVGLTPTLHLEPLALVNTTALLVGASIAVWLVFLLRSISIAKVKLGPRHVLPALLIIMFYPTLNSFFYFASLYKEATKSEFSW